MGKRPYTPPAKAPPWSCSCGAVDNWPHRAVCRDCNRSAPKTVLDRQRGERRKGDGAVSNGGGDSSVSKGADPELARLRNRVAELEKAAAAAAASAATPAAGDGTVTVDDDGDTAAERDKLRKTIADLREHLGAGHEEVVKREAKLKELLERRPTSTRILAATRKVQRLENRIAGSDKKVEECERALTNAVADLQVKKDERAALMEELAAAKKEQADAMAAPTAAAKVENPGLSLRQRYEVIKSWLGASGDLGAGEHGQQVAGHLLQKLENDLANEVKKEEAQAAKARAEEEAKKMAAAAPAASNVCDADSMEIDDDDLQKIVQASIDAAMDDRIAGTGDGGAAGPPITPKERIARVVGAVRSKGVVQHLKLKLKSKPDTAAAGVAPAAAAAAVAAGSMQCG